jgi:hypothetical protein
MAVYVGPRFTQIPPNQISGLLAWYSPQEEGAVISASTLINLSNNLVEGTVTSPAVVQLGDDSIKEVSFGSTGRVSFGDRYKPTTGVTLITIMKNTNLTRATQFHGGMGNTGDNGYFLSKINPNSVSFRAGTGNGFANSTTSAGQHILNQWQMFTGTYDGTTIKIYRGSELKANGGNPYTGNISYAGISQGYWATVQGQIGDSNRYWIGSGRVYIVYNRALTNDEISGIYYYYKNLGYVP